MVSRHKETIVELANVARGLNIKVYTIAFSAQADQTLMRILPPQVAVLLLCARRCNFEQRFSPNR